MYSASPGGDMNPISTTNHQIRVCICGQPFKPNIGGVRSGMGYCGCATIEDMKSSAEFVEITNIGTKTLPLQGLRFTGGIDYTFPNVSLAPGQYLIVAVDPIAFEFRYPGVSSSIVVGPYTGHLAGGGDIGRMELRGGCERLYGCVVAHHEIEHAEQEIRVRGGIAQTLRTDPCLSQE